jgi:hypothetical protein
MSAAPAVSEGLAVSEVLAVSVAPVELVVSVELVVPAESVVPVVSAIARRNCLRAAVVTVGSTIPNTAAARLTRTGQQQTGSGAPLVAIPWLIVRRTPGRTSRSSEAASKQA